MDMLQPPLGDSYAHWPVKEIRESEAALLYFVHVKDTLYDVVLKILHPLKDTRVDLLTLSSRQECQIEGLYWNTRFTKGVYLGLVQVFDYNKEWLCVGEIISSAEEAQGQLNPTTEYALMMCALPDSQRLDYVLHHAEVGSINPLLERLTKRIVAMHTHTEFLASKTSLLDEYGMLRGSYEQLERKLEHNLNFLNMVMDIDENRYGVFCHHLIDSMNVVIKHPSCKKYFEHRLKNQHIKRCHGDLKASNIWIDDKSEQDVDDGIKILDAIDFNNSYCYIDVLSDFAMLIIDVELCTRSPLLADSMIKIYLQHTKQRDASARFVLAYYLVEKAIISGVVNILYDHQFDLGLACLHIAMIRMENLNVILQQSL